MYTHRGQSTAEHHIPNIDMPTTDMSNYTVVAKIPVNYVQKYTYMQHESTTEKKLLSKNRTNF